MRIETLHAERMSLLTLRRRLTRTISLAKGDPYADVYAPVFEALRSKCNVVHEQELVLNDKITEAQALIDRCAIRLDAFASRVSREVLTLTRDNSDHFLYVAFFKKKQLSRFLMPVLGKQHESMVGWLKLCAASEHASLKALGVELEPLLKECTAAADAKTDAEQERRVFRQGERRRLFDEVNAERKTAHGELSKLPHKHTGLPLNYAEIFFQSGESSADDEEEEKEKEKPTPESVQVTIACLLERVAKQEALLEELKAKNAAKAEEVKADEATLATIEKSMAEQAAHAAALRAKIDAAKDGAK